MARKTKQARMTVQEAASYLGVGDDVVYAAIHNGTFANISPNGRRYFLIAELVQAYRQHLDETVSAPELAAMAGVTRAAVNLAIHKGKLSSRKVFGQHRIPRAEALAWAAQPHTGGRPRKMPAAAPQVRAERPRPVPPPELDGTVTVTQAAALASVTGTTVRDAIKRGKLPARKVKGAYHIPDAAAHAWAALPHTVGRPRRAA